MGCTMFVVVVYYSIHYLQPCYKFPFIPMGRFRVFDLIISENNLIFCVYGDQTV